LNFPRPSVYYRTNPGFVPDKRRFCVDWVAHGCPSPEEFERAVREQPSNGVIQVPEE
jgi:hypothetical protein